MPWVPLGLLVLSCLYFLYRGPYRAWDGFDGRDLSVFYTASRAWLDGASPYDPQTLRGVSVGTAVGLEAVPSLNPPTTFALLAPLAVLPWPDAERVALAVNFALVVACLVMVMSLADLRLREPRGLLFAAFVIALAPFHTAIALGQLTIAATALIVAALWGTEHDHPVLSGLCIALAVAMKPQMGLVFLLLFLLRRQWTALFSAITVLGGIAAVAVVRLAIAGVDWLPTLASNLSRSGVNDPAVPTAYLRVNLQGLASHILPGLSATAIDALVYGFGAAALALLFAALRHRVDREATLLLYAACSIATLVMFYNRIYSATLLILPVAWAFAPFRPRRLRAVALLVAGAAAVFVVPGAAALAHLPFPDGLRWVAHTSWWPYLLLHQSVALLVILAGLLVAATYRGVDYPREGEAVAVAPHFATRGSLSYHIPASPPSRKSATIGRTN